MGFDDIMISFAVSVGAGIATNILEDIKSNKDLDSRMNKCFNTALKKWEVSQETRELLYGKSLSYYTDLVNFLSEPTKGKNPKIKELLQLWIIEMHNDVVCSNFVNSHKQDIANCKLNDILVLLKNDLLTTIKGIEAKQDILLSKQEDMMSLMDSLMAKVQTLKKDEPINYASNLIALIRGSIAEMIDNLKLTTAKRVLEEIEKQFGTVVEANLELKAEILYRKGLAMLFSQTKKAKELFHSAYCINPNLSFYKKKEILRCIAVGDYETALTLSNELEDDKYRQIVDVVSSNNYELAFNTMPENLKNDLEVRQMLLECLQMKNVSCLFLFEDIEVAIPQTLTLSNINQWMFLLSNIRYETGDYIAFSFAVPQIDSIRKAQNVVNKFWEKLTETEILNCFPLIACLRSYWNFVCTQDKSWAEEFFSIDRTSFGEQKTVFCLMEASIFVLLGRNEEAFTSIVSASNDLDVNIIRVTILLFIQSNNIMHLSWVLSRMKERKVQINDEIAVLLAHSIRSEKAEEIRVQLDNVEFEKESLKELLVQLVNFNTGKDVKTVIIKEYIDDFSDEMKAYAANLLAYTGDTNLAFEMLKPIVDENIPDLKRHIFLSVLDRMQEKSPDLYRILIKNRRAGNYCDDHLLKKEYQLDSQIADYENALEAITLLYERHPENVENFVHYIFTLGHVNPDAIKQYETKILEISILDSKLLILAYRAFSENGYIETAAELLYNAAKSTDDCEIRTFYHNETLDGMISTIARKEYDVAEEGNYVLCDKDGQRLFYLASETGSNVSKAMLGVRKDDIVEVEIGFKPIKLTVVGVHNRYYKLAGDIMREAMDGSYPNLVPFEIDMENPLESLESILRKMSKDTQTPEERRKIAYSQYERGEIGLLQLVNDNNMLAGYYKYLFTPFCVYVNISLQERSKFTNIPADTKFVLDLPTIILFAEFTAKTGIQIQGQKTITKLLHEYIRFANKSAIRITDGDFYEAMSKGNLVKYNEYVDLDAKEHIQKLLEWTDNNCTDVIADKVLGVLQQGNSTPLKDQLFSSLSLLLEQKCVFVTDDRKIASMLPMVNIITTETYVRLFNDKQVAQEYSEFLLDHNFNGIEIDANFVCKEYKKMMSGQKNRIVTIMQNMNKNPFQLSVAIAACMELAQKELDTNTLKVTFTNMFAMALKGFTPNFRDNFVNNIIHSMSFPIVSLQITRQCLMDALIIANV